MDTDHHLQVDYLFLNQEFPDVHRWLDEAFGRTGEGSPYKHWLVHHHLKGIREKYAKDQMRYLAAYLHILADYIMNFNIPFVPANEKEAELMLKKLGAIKI